MISDFKSQCLLLIFFFTIIGSFEPLIGQERSSAGTNSVYKNGMIAYQTTSNENPGEIESLVDHLNGISIHHGDKFVLGGTVLWWANDMGTAAIANSVAIDAFGDADITGWTLNNMRVSKYSDENNIPQWEFATAPIDPYVDVSAFGAVVAAAAGQHFYLFDTTGVQFYDLNLPDSLYAVYTSVSRDGAMALLLATNYGSSNTARIYAFNISLGNTNIAWTYDVTAAEIGNWAGCSFSATGEKIAVAGRYHLYIFSSDGNLIWDRFLDNTESPPAISGDGNVVVTADNSGFVQTWHYNSTITEYELLWQYRIPPGTYTNWASSVGISADGNTILAGSLIFLQTGYDGSVICFDTYGNGTPKWIYGGIGDLVDDIKVSDDGKVAAAVTWGDYPAHIKPDLLVFDVQTGQVTFDVITPGSFFTCDITPDGKRVFAGGKAVHAREFGNGGRIYLCEIELGGGHVSGNVDLTNTGDDSGVIVSAVGTVRTAQTDFSGNYIIENISPGTYTIKAGKPGYNFGEVANVVVTEGNTTAGVNFSLNPFSTQPPTLSASSGLVGAIMLSWTSLFNRPERKKEIALMVGDSNLKENLSITSTRLISETADFSGSSLSGFHSDWLADSIAIYKSLVSGGPYQRIGSVAAVQNNFIDSSVFALKDYYYIINIYNETGQSIYSNEAAGRVSDTLLTFSLDVPEASIPTIDGILSPGEWDDAFKLDISDIFGYGGGVPIPQGSVFMYFKFDDNTDMLYVAGEDFLNPTLDDNEGFGFYFDDNNNNVFDGIPPFIREGNFWAYWHPTGSNLRFREIPTYIIDTLENAEVEFSDINGHLQGEVAIPMGFFEGYQLQVFAPDKIVGLGAFLIARQGATAIFNGWWPQTMNTVFNPQYFGDVGIDVSLLAPPQVPSNINVTRQGQDLLVTWDDPTLGLNNEPLPVPPTINVYKNGEFLKSFNAGVESYLDTDVYCVAWYEYQLEATIQIDTLTLTGPISAPVGEYACQEPVLTLISYDDGEWDAFYVASFTWENNKFGIRFTPSSYPTYVRRLQTVVNGNDAFNFTVQADNGGMPGDTLAGPYKVYDSSPATVGTIIKNLPGTDPPEITQGDFWVVINWLEQTPGSPGIGVDIDPPIDNRSMYYLTSSGWMSLGNLDIMVTSYVTDQPVGITDENKVIPLSFQLNQNYPNPFNPSTTISYQLPQRKEVTLGIFNVLGEKIRTLVNEVQEAGQYKVNWDGKNDSGRQMASGVYLYRIAAGSYNKVMKMILLR